MPAPKGIRKDKAFSLATVRDSMPGSQPVITAKSGYSPQTVGRMIRELIKQRKAYQSGWTFASNNRWIPEYSAGRKPVGFVLPECPPMHTKTEYHRQWKAEKRATDPIWKAKVNAAQTKRRERKRKSDPVYAEKERARKAAYYARQDKDELNRRRREQTAAKNTRPGRRKPNAADLAHANQLLQLTDPKGISERVAGIRIAEAEAAFAAELEEDDELTDMG